MSLGTFFEWLAARKQPRFESYRRARLTYEAYLARIAVDFSDLTDDHYRAARADPGLAQAENDYRRAIELSQEENDERDVAIALYQLGMLLHLRGRLEEARDLFCQALDILGGLPQVERVEQSAMSGCHYHLGLIALRFGDAHEARTQLERSVHIDMCLGDVSGAAMGRRALSRCPPVDASWAGERTGASHPPDPEPNAEGPGPHATQAAPPPRARPAQEPAGYGHDSPVPAPSPPAYSPDQDVIWVLTYSVTANDRLLSLLESLRGQFPRKTLVHRVAFGSPDSAQSIPEPIANDARLCAAVLVVEPQGLSNEAFRYWAKWCMTKVARCPDFRMYVCLEGMSLDEFSARANSDTLVADLLDTVQIAQLPTPDELHLALVPFLRALDDIRSAAHWRRTRLFLADLLGRVASIIQVACGAALAAATITSVMSPSIVHLAGSLSPDVRGLIATGLAVPTLPLLIVVILPSLQGTAAASKLIETNARARWWLVGAVLLIPFGIGLPQEAGVSAAWTVLGVVLGALLDVFRRNSAEAQRARISLERAVDMAEKQLPAPLVEALAVKRPLDPIACPLFPALATKVFISYTRSSAWSRKLAAELYEELRASGVQSFLDRTAIPEGASWRRHLNEGISDANVFLAVLDRSSLRRTWVAAELMAALLGRRLTYLPDVILLTEPTLTDADLTGALPVFRAAWRGDPDDPSDSATRRIPVTPDRVRTIVSGLHQHAYSTPSVFPPRAAALLSFLTIPFASLGPFCVFGGWVALPFALLDHWQKFDLGALLASWGILVPAYLLAAYWLGFAIRLTVASRYEVNHDEPRTLAAIHLAAAFGLAAILMIWAGQVPSLVVGWAAALALVGGTMARLFISRIGLGPGVMRGTI